MLSFVFRLREESPSIFIRIENIFVSNALHEGRLFGSRANICVPANKIFNSKKRNVPICEKLDGTEIED